MVDRVKILNALKKVESYGKLHPEMWNISWENGSLLKMMVLARGAKSILEVGTSDGFSTIWLAWAAAITGGKVLSIERDPGRASMAADNLSDAGLNEYVHILIDDAKDALDSIEASASFDFAFLDAAKNEYIVYFQKARPRLVRGAIVVADDAITERNSMKAYLEKVEHDPSLESALIDIDDGVEITYLMRNSLLCAHARELNTDLSR